MTTGSYNTWEYLDAISHTIGNFTIVNNIDDSEVSDESGEEDNIVTINQNNCVVCLTLRTTDLICIRCRHANYCTECTKKIEEFEHACAVCRIPIEEAFKSTQISVFSFELSLNYQYSSSKLLNLLIFYTFSVFFISLVSGLFDIYE